MKYLKLPILTGLSLLFCIPQAGGHFLKALNGKAEKENAVAAKKSLVDSNLEAAFFLMGHLKVKYTGESYTQWPRLLQTAVKRDKSC